MIALLFKYETGYIPEFVREKLVRFDFIVPYLRIHAGRVADDECHAPRVRAEFFRDFDRVDAVPK